jgi:hypothetical protein
LTLIRFRMPFFSVFVSFLVASRTPSHGVLFRRSFNTRINIPIRSTSWVAFFLNTCCVLASRFAFLLLLRLVFPISVAVPSAAFALSYRCSSYSGVSSFFDSLPLRFSHISFLCAVFPHARPFLSAVPINIPPVTASFLFV